MSFITRVCQLGLLVIGLLAFAGGIYFMRESQWIGAFVCFGLLVLLAWMNELLRVEALRTQRPWGYFTPRPGMQRLLLVFLGISGIIAAVQSAVGGSFVVATFWGVAGLWLFIDGVRKFRN